MSIERLVYVNMVTFCLSFLTMYLVVAFVKAELNVFMWQEGVRGSLLFFSFIMYVVCLIVYFSKKR